MSLDYPKITKTLIFINYNRKKGIELEKDAEYIKNLLDKIHPDDLEDYYLWLADDINYGKET